MKKENSDNGNAPKDTPKRKYTSKQVAAIIGIALLALLYTNDVFTAYVFIVSGFGQAYLPQWRCHF